MCLSMIINLKIVQVNHPVTLTAVGGGVKYSSLLGLLSEVLT